MARKLTSTVAAEKRRRDTAKLYLRGHSMAQIAEVTGVHVKTVQHDLLKVRAAWREQATASVQRHVERELAKIDLVEAEAWEAWEQSKAEEVHNLTEISSEDAAPGAAVAKPGTRKVSRRQHNRLPSDAYLSRIAWCIEQRCKLLNLYPARSGEAAGGPAPGVGSIDVTRVRMVFSESKPEELELLAGIYERLGVTKPPAAGEPVIIDAEADDADA